MSSLTDAARLPICLAPSIGSALREPRDYLIFYRVFDGLVEVIHVLHGARNYEALLFPDELDPE